MFAYDKKLQYPVRIQNPNPALAKIILTQYGGPDGELGASLRYLSQRYSMPFDELRGLLTDIGRIGAFGDDWSHCSSADPEPQG
jgi:spore coat protein JC